MLLATAAYTVAAQMDWSRGLSRSIRNAPRFYSVAVISILLGGAISFAGLSPITLLFVASIIGGIRTPVGLAYLMLIAGDHNLLRGHEVSITLRLAGWVIVTVITLMSVLYLAQQIMHGG